MKKTQLAFYGLLACFFALSMAGCAGIGGAKPDADYAAYLAAHQAQQAAYKPEIQLVRIKAQPGQTITMGGVAEFTVAMPAAPQAGVQQAQARPSEFVEALRVVAPVVGTVGGIWAAGNAATGLANAVGNAARTPQANVTTTTNSYPVNTTTTTDNHAVTSPATTPAIAGAK